ncbi:MAG: phosphopantothenoylcysteine decarboxylase [Planctomycetaceae bacterium]|nr:phosphopantothenoylcysteine decarboxylase [Planctomycetaceae bacterium]MCA9108872.1 phosphopantothenoylcysteine decarboxylase [Planctomycetaceae bacterium]
MKDREVLLGVSGGIAAYKAADLTSKLMQAGAKVTVVLTPAATKFIGATTFEALTGRRVLLGMFDAHEHFIGEHIGQARRADAYVIAPATADMLAKLAHGQADDLVSTLALSVTCPRLVAPAMNNEMWTKPPVQRNVEQLREDGWEIIDPGSGWLSCGSIGPGRMAEPVDIMARIEFALV